MNNLEHMCVNIPEINQGAVSVKLGHSCKNCAKKDFCQEICPQVEKILNKRSINGYSQRHINRKERLFYTEELERIAGERAFKLKFGYRKIPEHIKEMSYY